MGRRPKPSLAPSAIPLDRTHGQWMFVDPASRLVMVHTAVRKQPGDPGEGETVVLWRRVVQGLGSN
jgi:hypothetical protein